MLDPADFIRLQTLLVTGADPLLLRQRAREIQMRMNPHPDGQMELNVPTVDGEELMGCQHKYRETVLYFPLAGQTCHAYCTYCFRWPQFVGIERLKFAMRGTDRLVSYLRGHPEVTDVLVTGGDPLVMSSAMLRKSIEPLLGEGLGHIHTIRIGTRALSYWPYRFTTDRDADDLLRLFEAVRRSGRQLALMAHFSHPRELQTNAAQEALRRVRDTGAVIRCQAPLIRHINDSSEVWAELWRQQVRLGLVPYYMFVARDTGPRSYFEVPLATGLRIYSEAITRVSGLGRTVRGPIMSADARQGLVRWRRHCRRAGCVRTEDDSRRDPDWANRVFFAHFDPHRRISTSSSPHSTCELFLSIPRQMGRSASGYPFDLKRHLSLRDAHASSIPVFQISKLEILPRTSNRVFFAGCEWFVPVPAAVRFASVPWTARGQSAFRSSSERRGDRQRKAPQHDRAGLLEPADYWQCRCIDCHGSGRP